MSTELPEQPLSRKPYQLLLSGIDSLYVSFYLDGIGFDWEELAYRQEMAKQERGRCAKISLGNRDWILSPSGRYPYRFVLNDAHCEVRLAEKMQPCCHVQFKSYGLWTVGLAGLVADIQQWFVAVGTRATRPELVSRCDFAFDFHMPVVDFDASHFVTRLKKDATWREHGSYQSFQFGQGDVVVRLYDKVAEIAQASGKAWFFDLWAQQEDVWRVEFQVRSEKLKEYGIKTLQDAQAQPGHLLRWLTGEHTTLRRPGRDGNRSRWPLHPLWAAVQRAAEEERYSGPVETFDPDNSLAYCMDQQVKSLYGSLKGLAAINGLQRHRDTPGTLEELLQLLPLLLKRHHHPDLWRNDIQDRMDARRLGQ